MDPTDAGHGEHHVYRIAVKGADLKPLEADVHYLGLDAVAWFLNKQSGFFSERTASGTVGLMDNRETYRVALATFELEAGARVAPVFDRSILPDRGYRGGGIVLTIALSSFRRDKVITSLLKTAADASLGIVAGMVQTATLVGPQAVLAAAGESLVGGTRQLLTANADKLEPVFAGDGLQLTIRGSDISGSVSYLLFHRGATLDEGKLSVAKLGAQEVPYLDGRLLEDGAWLLLRLRRSAKYDGERGWSETWKTLAADLSNLMDEFAEGIRLREEVEPQLRPSTGGVGTLYDRYVALRTLIQSDGVLTKVEARDRVGEFAQAFSDARATAAAAPAAAVAMVPGKRRWETLGAGRTSPEAGSRKWETLGAGDSFAQLEAAGVETFRQSNQPVPGPQPEAAFSVRVV